MNNQWWLPIHNDVPDNYGWSQWQAMWQWNYIKQLDNWLNLHVHAPNWIVTWAKVFDWNTSTIINNTQASILDALPWTIKTNTWMQR
jgi:hypothetical protein